MSGGARQTIVTLDLEGVLIPEIWIAVAERTGIDGLRRTTRDEPDYDVLMRYRLDLLAEHGLSTEEYERLIGILGREPSLTELGIFSVMWSEAATSTRQFILDFK